jgi:hypothetical protein
MKICCYLRLLYRDVYGVRESYERERFIALQATHMCSLSLTKQKRTIREHTKVE